MTTGYDDTLRDPASNRYANVPDDDEKKPSRSLPGMTANPTLTTKKAKFIPQTGVLSSFYFNGPSTDPYDYHSAQQQQIQAQTAWWSDPLRAATLDHYSGLLGKYGHTNSPGTLWALAQSGLDPEQDAVKSMLTADATAYNADYQQGLPAAVGSPQEQTTMATTAEDEKPSSWWDVPQWATRNLFAAASMPMEAVQGAWRESGGIIADEDKSLMEKIGGVALTSAELVAPPLAAITDGLLMDDDEHQNPWEQTDFGQQLISAAGGAGADAFGSLTAGLDFEKAKEMLSSDPAYDAERQAVTDNPALMNTTLEDIAKTHDLRGGAGWFIDETSVIGQAQRQSTYNSWAIPGPNGAMTAWTLGRGIASVPAGPEWAGYNFTSGLIDAVAAIAGDPTIWGGKLGLVSKSVRGVGLLTEKAGVEGAELALTVGKEARKVRSGRELINRNSQKALSDYNKMNPDAQIDPTTWGAMDLSDQIALVHQVKSGEKAQEAASKAMPTMGSVVRRVRDMRRAASERWRGERQVTEGFAEADTLTRQQQLWTDFAANAADTAPTPKRAWEADEVLPTSFDSPTNQYILAQDRVSIEAASPGALAAPDAAYMSETLFQKARKARIGQMAERHPELVSLSDENASGWKLAEGATLDDLEATWMREFYPDLDLDAPINLYRGMTASGGKADDVFQGSMENAAAYWSINPAVANSFANISGGTKKVAVITTTPRQLMEHTGKGDKPILLGVSPYSDIAAEGAVTLNYTTLPQSVKDSVRVADANTDSALLNYGAGLDNTADSLFGAPPAGKSPSSKYGDYVVETQGRGKWTVTAPDGFVKQYGTKAEAQKAAQLGQKNIDSNATPSPMFSGEKYQTWMDNLPPEDRALWDESVAYVEDLQAKGRITLADPDEDPAEYFRQVEAIVGTHFKNLSEKSLRAPKGGTLRSQVEAAATMSIVDNSGNLAAQVLKGVDYAGVTLAADVQPGVLQRAIVDGQDVMSGWVGDIAPVFVGAEDVVLPEVGQRILVQLTDILKHPDHKTVKPSIKKTEKGGLADQAATQIRDFENPLPTISARLSSPGFTYSALLNTFAHYGLDGYLDDMLRKEQLDGILGVTSDRAGVWMGDHPLMEHYKFPSSAVDNATTLGGIMDETARAAALKALPKTAVRTGLRGGNIDDVAQWTVQAGGRHKTAAARRTRENATVIEEARAAEIRLQSDLAAVDQAFTDPTSALKSFLSYEAGIGMDAAKGVNVNMEGLRWFLFGTGPTAALRARVLSKMAHMLSADDIKTLRRNKPGTKEYDDLAGAKVAELAQITRAKWDPDTYKAILRNAIDEGGEDGLLRVLGPRLGLEGVERGSITRGVKLLEGDGMKSLQTWRTSNRFTKRWVNRMTSERPGGRVVSLDNSSDVIDAVIKYGMYAKVPIKDINAAIGKVILADGTFGAVSTNVDVLKSTFRNIGNVLSDRLAESNILFQGDVGAARLDELQRGMRDSVNLFLSGSTGEKNDLAARIGAQGDMTHYIDDVGEKVEYPRVQLDSELLNGEIHLPSVDEWQAGMGRLAAALHRFRPVEKTYDLARSIYDNFFRTSLLVFRGAYIIRNSAEMQIRMYLNGHHSVFNDPATLIGMTMGNFTKQGRESIFNDFAKYTDTILGEAWDAGPDKAIAFANKTEKYFSLLREAHSLTDPRVYQSTIFKGWQRVNVEGSQFAEGWANELIMLNNSDIARVVLGNIPYDFTAQQGFRTTTDAAVAWMLSSRDDAVRIRQRLTAADEKFGQIFASEAMTRDYLFDNPNSVLNRVKKFTMDDASLVEFIKTGVMRTKDGSVHVKQVPQLKDRIRAIRKGLNEKFYDSGKPLPAVVDHMKASNVTVSWIDSQALRKGSGFVDGFFRVANNIERTGSVGPEFRMAYWDRLTELLPGLRVEDVPRALKAAETTLSKIQRMNPNGVAGNIGRKHPAWKALNKAQRENTSGLMTLDELHVIATDFAADHVKNIFYDAARRNNFWTATRLIFPFGQAWGNTIAEWTKLGAKRPAKVYTALKALNAAGESGSSTIYETGQALGAFGDYEEGMAPWDQDPNGGFFYSDQYGDTSFMLPYVGRAAAVPANLLAKLNGFNANLGSIDMSSNTQSMNLALGAENINPGTSFLVPMGLSLFPDSDIVDSLQSIANPYGPRNALESSLPAWASNFLGGVGALPIVGDVVSDWVSPFSASVKNKNARDAVAILSASGQYDMTDPISVRKMQDDANNLAPSLLLISGLFKNVMPVNPTQQLSVDTTGPELTAAAKGGAGTQAAFAIVNNLYQQMLEEAGGDTAAAKEEFVRQFGAPFLFVVTGNKKGYSRIPSSQAMTWARTTPENYETARAFPDYFSLFFPKGDPTDLTAKLWIEEQTNKSTESKTVEEVTDESISLMIRTQRARIDALEVNGDISPDQADLWRADIEETYKDTAPGQSFNSQTTADQLVQVDAMLAQNPSLRDTPAGKAYGMAMQYRGDALSVARERSGSESTTLSGKKVATLKKAYLIDLEDLLGQYPDFRPLYNVLSKEWD